MRETAAAGFRLASDCGRQCGSKVLLGHKKRVTKTYLPPEQSRSGTTEPGAGVRRYRQTVPRGRGITAMASRDDLGARNVPAIDWLELFIWTLLITMSSALALLLMR